MRTQNLLCGLVVILSLAFGVGCGASKSLEGSWKVSGLQGMDPSATVTWHLRPGGEMEMVMSSPNPVGDGKLSVTLTGTYKVEGETINFSGTNVSLKTEGMTEDVKKMMEEGFNSQKTNIIEGAKKGSGKIKWESADKAIITGEDSTATLERIK